MKYTNSSLFFHILYCAFRKNANKVLLDSRQTFLPEKLLIIVVLNRSSPGIYFAKHTVSPKFCVIMRLCHRADSKKQQAHADSDQTEDFLPRVALAQNDNTV